MDGSPIGLLGLERVCWVRFRRGRADVAGIVRRRPVVRPVPIAVAAELVARGVPVVFSGDGTGDGVRRREVASA